MRFKVGDRVTAVYDICEAARNGIPGTVTAKPEKCDDEYIYSIYFDNGTRIAAYESEIKMYEPYDTTAGCIMQSNADAEPRK